MAGSLTDVSGIQIGHYSDPQRGTGCTVILCENGAVAGVDTWGPVLGTHEIDLVRTGQLVNRVDAVALVGRSSFGLASVAGVMKYLEERRQGFEVQGTDMRVPIVTAASIWDITGPDTGGLDATCGYSACAAASVREGQIGMVGVGTGANTPIRGAANRDLLRGLRMGSYVLGTTTVAALIVVNGMDDIRGSSRLESQMSIGPLPDRSATLPISGTALAVVGTDIPLSRPMCNIIARVALDSLRGHWYGIGAPDMAVVTFALSTARSAETSGSIPPAALEAVVTELVAEVFSGDSASTPLG